MQIEGKNVVVTGGASGIGAAMAQRFAASGAAHVVIADLDETGATTLASRIGGTPVACDVGSEDSVNALVAEAIDTMGHIDLFCANAGVGVGGGLDVPLENWELSWRVNVLGPVLAARAVIPHMERRGGGTFLITASAAGLVTGPVSFNYAVSKHAAVGVAEWLAINHGQTVNVACLCPTIVDTPMAEHFGGLEQPLSADQVADAVVDGLAENRFLILPMPATQQMIEAKAADTDAFLARLAARVAEL